MLTEADGNRPVPGARGVGLRFDTLRHSDIEASLQAGVERCAEAVPTSNPSDVLPGSLCE